MERPDKIKKTSAKDCIRFKRLMVGFNPSYVCISCMDENNIAPKRKNQHTTINKEGYIKPNAKQPAPITISTPPTRNRMDCILLSCFILFVRIIRRFVSTQHIDILIIGFHKISLAGNSLYGLRIMFQFPKLS